MALTPFGGGQDFAAPSVEMPPLPGWTRSPDRFWPNKAQRFDRQQMPGR